MEDKFIFLKMQMDRLTKVYGFFLIGWAVVVSVLSNSNSITSWIPAFIGIPLILTSILTRVYPARRKIWMHMAIFFGLASLLGGLDFFRGLFYPDGPFANLAAGASKFMLFTTGAIYCLASFRSFRWARKNIAENN